ncbi:hypothetical protein ACFSYG_08660 [Leeuwenhoekiella polynyae]|uniref:Heavy-metal-associated domain-containing protein n=1 Tax=Leeuwenhoekiella polynyae TaxID=1550906 RepID=A0A4Q0PI24_9FLAO|nr:hypothetical protein [Leeuwenhoekiella polynyae]RXG26218.1 hypothetical protein DSM02_212 [Leeuwenhoekiella polynyae]
MKAALKISDHNFKGTQEVILMCLNRIMEVRVLEINLQKNIIAVDYAKPSVYERIKNELKCLGLLVGEYIPLK